ncbi:hypothetical protein [Mesorhizobium sp. M7A.F.Ca.US.006.01.1.1]|uniref:hypothetical protein n=1 Tax=Mesorhizobium sp. M7A.F.Ca.US.006.01.1.1 TaxID=2496707 RepID=UPI0019D2CF2B|nr:hypothetical protein [Mesorhizobium sp. M7A.F.Ca.US.006.01.1.1]
MARTGQRTISARSSKPTSSVRRRTYSKRVSIDRIADEGHNLNISRYIRTAEDELEIDLIAANEDLVDIEKQFRAATAKHNTFLRELGLPTLPLSKG